jgi:hypothetical protein
MESSNWSRYIVDFSVDIVTKSCKLCETFSPFVKSNLVFLFMGSLKTSCFVQTQFLSSGSTGVGQWVVPITLCCCSYSRQAKFLFHGKQEDFDLSASGFTDCQKKDGFWIKLNVNQTSFYRVSYDEELAARLRYAIETNKLGAADRYGKFS